MAALRSVLTKEFMKDKMPLPHYGEMAERYYREFCKPSYRSLAAKGPEHVYQYFEKLGMKALNEQTEMMQQGVAEDGALEIVKEWLFPRGEENMK